MSPRFKKSFRPRKNIHYLHTNRAERAAARAQVKAAEEEEDQKVKALKEAQRKAEMVTTPGQKRKRVPFPDAISNPKGCSFGLVLDNFGCDSSDEDDGLVTTPSKQPNKVRRTGGPQLQKEPMISLPDKAKTYPQIPRSRVFVKDDLRRKEIEKHGFWPPPPPTPRSWDVQPLTPIYAAVKSTVPSTTESDIKLELSSKNISNTRIFRDAQSLLEYSCILVCLRPICKALTPLYGRVFLVGLFVLSIVVAVNHKWKTFDFLFLYLHP